MEDMIDRCRPNRKWLKFFIADAEIDRVAVRKSADEIEKTYQMQMSLPNADDFIALHNEILMTWHSQDRVLLARKGNIMDQPLCFRNSQVQEAKIGGLASRSIKGLESRHQGATMENFERTTIDQQKVFKMAEKWLSLDPAGAWTPRVIVGPPLTGKTRLVASCAVFLRDAGASVVFVKTQKFLDDAKSTWSASAPGDKKPKSAVIRDLLWPNVVVLDNYGDQVNDEREAAIVAELICDRWEANKTVVLISTKSGDVVRQMLGEKAAARMSDNGALIMFSGKPYQSQPGNGKLF